MAKKKLEYQQLDIMAALRGKDVIFEESKPDIEEKKKVTLFEIVDDVRWGKTGKCLDTEAGKQAFVPFLVIKILSLDEDICQKLNVIQFYLNTLSKEQMYVMLLNLLPKKKCFNKGFGKKESELIDITPFIANYFQCSIKEAAEYRKIMGPEWTQLFIKKCGDFIHE